MISEFSVKPKAKNRRAIVLFWSFIALAVVAVALYAIAPRFKGFVGIGAIGMLTVAIYIFSKYIGIEYSYEIAFGRDGLPLFLVRQTVGRRSTLMCNVALSSIRAVKKENKKERAAYVSPVGCAKYVFTPTVSPDEVYRVVSAENGTRVEIIIECSEEFASLLRSYAEEARSLFPESED